MKISEIMTTAVVTIGPDDSLDVGIALLDKHNVRHLPVVHDGALLSMISRRDLSLSTGWLTCAERKTRGQKAPQIVRDIMRDRVVTLSPDHDVEAAASMMIGKRAGAIPILKDGVLVGLVTSSDILSAIRDRNPAAEWARTTDQAENSSKVSEFMHHKPASLAPGKGLAEAGEICREKALRHLSITEDGVVVGLVSERELRFQMEESAQATETSLSEVMVKDVITIGPNEDLAVAADSMIEHHVSGLPVVDDDGLVGFLTDQDVIQYFTAKYRVPAL